jgi:hypothetical protein
LETFFYGHPLFFKAESKGSGISIRIPCCFPILDTTPNASIMILPHSAIGLVSTG